MMEWLDGGNVRRGAGLEEMSRSMTGGGAGKRSRSCTGPRGGGVTLRKSGQRRPEVCPQAQQSMQRVGSLQAARRCFLLRHRRQRPRKRLKKAERAGLGAVPWRRGGGGMGRGSAGRGVERPCRPRLEVTTSQGGKDSSSEALTGGASQTTMERRRGRSLSSVEARAGDERSGSDELDLPDLEGCPEGAESGPRVPTALQVAGEGPTDAARGKATTSESRPGAAMPQGTAAPGGRRARGRELELTFGRGLSELSSTNMMYQVYFVLVSKYDVTS
jgi:hypothetical protein